MAKKEKRDKEIKTVCGLDGVSRAHVEIFMLTSLNDTINLVQTIEEKLKTTKARVSKDKFTSKPFRRSYPSFTNLIISLKKMK